MGDVSWTGWSSMPKLDLIRTTGASAGTPAQTLVTDFRDTWRVAVGGNYQYRQDLKLKFGLAYLMIADTTINNDQSSDFRGLVKGSYAGSAWILGAQYSMPF